MDGGGGEAQEPVAEEVPVQFLEEHRNPGFLRWLYKLHDSRETSVGPMRFSRPNEFCDPGWGFCRRHCGCAMLQIFSLKLITGNLPPAATSGGGPIEVYGFMAFRDLMNPLRNYFFNRSRDDPLVIIPQRAAAAADPVVINLSGPKRGVNLGARVLLEYDMKIKKRREQDGDDVALADGVAILSNRQVTGRLITTRLPRAPAPAVLEVTHARFPKALEATVQVRIIVLLRSFASGIGGGGVDLSVTAGFVPDVFPNNPEVVVPLFRGVVDEPRELDRFAVAVASDSYLILTFETRDAAGARHLGEVESRAMPHGGITIVDKFEFAVVQVKVTWSNLVNNPIPEDDDIL